MRVEPDLTPRTDLFDPARRVADAVLFEGYLLYPYRASAAKNQVRWQFGVLMPRQWAEGEYQEPWSQRFECLLEPEDTAVLHLRVRCLQVQTKNLEQATADGFVPVPELTVDGVRQLSWDEAVEAEFDTALPLAELLEHDERVVPFEIPAERLEEPIHDAAGTLLGRTVRERRRLDGRLLLSAQQPEGPYGVVRLGARVENTSTEQSASRDEALRYALVAAHTVLAVTDGQFISLLEPPEWARPLAESCTNVGVWPVLVGEDDRRDVVLVSPIILYDYPSIAPESPGDLFDGLENDEILTLRTMVLTDDEKREARATDPRAAQIIDRVDDMPQEVLDRLHGAIRYLRGVGATDPSTTPAWFDPIADAAFSPETDSVMVAGVPLSRGSRVLLRPSTGRADAQDMFLDGRVATVAAVLSSVEDAWYLAVTPDDDPEATEVMLAHGRYLYFSPDEVVPLEAAS
jgi:hypothetical protein